MCTVYYVHQYCVCYALCLKVLRKRSADLSQNVFCTTCHQPIEQKHQLLPYNHFWQQQSDSNHGNQSNCYHNNGLGIEAVTCGQYTDKDIPKANTKVCFFYTQSIVSYHWDKNISITPSRWSASHSFSHFTFIQSFNPIVSVILFLVSVMFFEKI